MNIRLIPAEQLTPEHVAAWADIQRAEAALDSPYFRPEFTQAVAAVRGDVEVGVLEEGGEPVGFFPFQRGRGNVARPVGGTNVRFPRRRRRRRRGLGPAATPPRLPAGGVALRSSDRRRRNRCGRTIGTSLPRPTSICLGGWDGYQARQLAGTWKSFKRAMRKLRHAATRGRAAARRNSLRQADRSSAP